MAQRLVLACHPGGVSGDDPELLSRWQALAGPGPLARDAWADLIGRWSEPHRSYHGLAHLAAVLAVLDVYAGPVADLDPVRLAAWYPRRRLRPDPRGQRGAQRRTSPSQRFRGLGVEPARVAEVRRLVLVTRTHLYAAADTDAALLCDADLAVLGAPAGGVRRLRQRDPGRSTRTSPTMRSGPAGPAVLRSRCSTGSGSSAPRP
ncbi:MAG: hypothetical protein WKF47_15385 [Geodermatophilaceae bacterium]